MEKQEARRQAARAIRQLTAEDRAERSERIRKHLATLPDWTTAKAVMGFISMPDEVDTLPIIADWLAAGKRVYVPRTFVKAGRMIPVRLRDLADLRVGEYGIREPNGDESCSPGEIDFILVPARAFDLRGNRLGRGGGFYDRFMADPAFHATRCGVCFACQVRPAVPHGARDLPVEILVTEDSARRCET